MAYATEPVACHSDVSDSDEMIVIEQPMWTLKRKALVGFGLTCLVASAIACASALNRPTRKNGITARTLLESDDMITAQAKNQINILKLQGDEAAVRRNVANGIKRFEDKLQASEPAKWRELNEVALAPHQSDALLRIVSSISDPRVQELGQKVAKAFADGRSEGREGVKTRLKQIFSESELPKLRQLKSELFGGLHKVAPEGKQVTFHADSLRMMKALPDKSTSVQARRLDSADLFSDSLAGASDESSSLAFFGALEEQARVLLDQIDFVGTSFGWDSQIPSEAKAGVGGLDFLTNVADCLSRADGNDVKEGLCPVRYASAAFDSISAVDNEMGIDNGELGLDESFDGGNKAGKKTLWDSMLNGGGSSSSSSGNFLSKLIGSGSSSSSGTAPAAAPASSSSGFTWQ